MDLYWQRILGEMSEETVKTSNKNYVKKVTEEFAKYQIKTSGDKFTAKVSLNEGSGFSIKKFSITKLVNENMEAKKLLRKQLFGGNRKKVWFVQNEDVVKGLADYYKKQKDLFEQWISFGGIDSTLSRMVRLGIQTHQIDLEKQTFKKDKQTFKLARVLRKTILKSKLEMDEKILDDNLQKLSRLGSVSKPLTLTMSTDIINFMEMSGGKTNHKKGFTSCQMLKATKDGLVKHDYTILAFAGLALDQTTVILTVHNDTKENPISRLLLYVNTDTKEFVFGRGYPDHWGAGTKLRAKSIARAWMLKKGFTEKGVKFDLETLTPEFEVKDRSDLAKNFYVAHTVEEKNSGRVKVVYNDFTTIDTIKEPKTKPGIIGVTYQQLKQRMGVGYE